MLLRKDLTTFFRVVRLWTVVLCANFVGTYLFALSIGHVALFSAPVRQAFTEIGLSHLGAGFGIVLTRAIFAGWLIALMVWLLPGAESARVSIIIIITYLVGLGGLNHIIAGSTTMLYLVVTISWGTYFTSFFFPTLFGNILGGVSLVAALGHAQVVGGKE